MSLVGCPNGSGRALRLDPFALPLRYAAPDQGADGNVRQIELDRERVVLRRSVTGISMKVGLPISTFLGISIHLEAADGETPAMTAVMLEHHDPALCIPLFVATQGDEAMAEWTLWGRTLGLPLLVADGDGALREPFARLGRVRLGNTQARRKRRAAIRARRPSIMMRRKPGRPIPSPIVHCGEREIVARH